MVKGPTGRTVKLLVESSTFTNTLKKFIKKPGPHASTFCFLCLCKGTKKSLQNALEELVDSPVPELVPYVREISAVLKSSVMYSKIAKLYNLSDPHGDNTKIINAWKEFMQNRLKVKQLESELDAPVPRSIARKAADFLATENNFNELAKLIRGITDKVNTISEY